MSSSAPKRRLDVRQESPQRVVGKRVAARRTRRSFIPSPAMAGASALILAAFGSAFLSSADDGNTLKADQYQTISQSYTGSAKSVNGDVDISRSFDRTTFDKQVKAQASQVRKTQQNLASAVGKEAKKDLLNQWVLPVTGYHLTARFGQSSGLWATTHTGLDFAGAAGTTIISVAAGTVKSAGYEGAYGNRTVITITSGPDAGTDLWYCHQSRISVKPGDVIAAGQVIGYTGSTGNVTGPHLHLEVHPGGGDPVDPFTALSKHGVQP